MDEKTRIFSFYVSFYKKTEIFRKIILLRTNLCKLHNKF